MKFTFLLCVNRDDGYLDQAVDSVLGQDDPNFDFIIVANNCTDELWTKVCGYSDPRIRAVRSPIGQLAYCLNFGVSMAEDGYLLRMDADDICLPERLRLTKAFVDANGWPDIVGADVLLIDEHSALIGKRTIPRSDRDIRRALWLRNPLVHPACAIKVSTVISLRGYAGGFMSEDYDLWLRASRTKDLRFSAIEDVVLKYRISSFQARGQLLGYAETAGHLFREYLLSRKIRFFAGALIAGCKSVIRGRRLQ